eukprot:TRINITY_DN1170_c0_g1_i2.p3 TRINITY_DN1170_c0_g1~~TRINITY_DN1170_c0_g1_i2.p3  ORF type:complete len:523 (-),score=26.28 TRINITY_DN1170_c0_g1_i2:3419-4987(-)
MDSNYRWMRKVSLVQECTRRGLDSDGTIPVLVRRLQAHDKEVQRIGDSEEGGDGKQGRATALEAGSEEEEEEEEGIGEGERGEEGTFGAGRVQHRLFVRADGRPMSPFRRSRSGSPLGSPIGEAVEPALEPRGEKRKQADTNAKGKGREQGEGPEMGEGVTTREEEVATFVRDVREREQWREEARMLMRSEVEAMKKGLMRQFQEKEEMWEKERRKQADKMQELEMEREQMLRRMQESRQQAASMREGAGKDTAAAVLAGRRDQPGQAAVRLGGPGSDGRGGEWGGAAPQGGTEGGAAEGRRLDRLEELVAMVVGGMGRKEEVTGDEWSLVTNRFTSLKAEQEWLHAREQKTVLEELRASTKDPGILQKLGVLSKEVDRLAFRAKVEDEWGEEAVAMVDGLELPRFSKQEKQKLKKTKKEWKDVHKVYRGSKSIGKSYYSPFNPLPVRSFKVEGPDDEFFRTAPVAGGRTRGLGAGGGNSREPRREPPPEQPTSELVCFYCHTRGHLKRDCPRLLQREGRRT